MMLSGRVAIVTGAGGGLGRQYAIDLARRGARVVVNDLGCSTSGTGSSETAALVVSEIKNEGGIALANPLDISLPGSGEALVDAALEHFGQVDVVVNNAGIGGQGKPNADVTWQDIQAVLSTNLLGAAALSLAAWPHMKAAGYGRIVNVTSHAIFGTPGALSYTMARSGCIGLTTSLASEGRHLGIKVNAVMPAAYTRMTANIPNEAFVQLLQDKFEVSAISPLVVLLASEECPGTGEVFHAAGGMVGRIALAAGPGLLSASQSAEGLLANWDQVRDVRSASYPADTDEVMSFIIARVMEGAGPTVSMTDR